ncbi:MAG TPA: trimethylamine methyltransferase family protein [Steroidobacteraceae bacterium]|jgi:trimethylamine--corrinoid protein Co-methyltransferase|nr:trimethylamine methyltransferase family protein [Steroidobacteraceae bacterium]
MDSPQDRTRRAGRRRSAQPATEQTQRSAAAGYRHWQNPFEPLRVLSDDEVARIHESALSILENVGMRVLLPEARARYAAAGAMVDEASEMVRLDRSLIASALSTAPSSIELRAPNPERNAVIGGRGVAVVPVSGPPNASDLDRGRRPGSLRDLHELVKLSQSFDVIHLLGPSIEPQDVAPPFRHLESTLAQLTLSDKVPFVYSRGAAQVADCFAMIRTAHGLSEDAFRGGVFTYTNINTNSPRQIDIPMAQGIVDFATAGQLLIITPFTLAGAMAPITVVGAIALAHAEALAGIALAQIVRPGTPVVYGGFTSNVDMKSGSPAFGTPEYVKASFATGQLARHVGLPWRSSNATASNIADGQAVYESQMSLWGALMGGCNLLIHGAGWLEGGLCASYEKFIIDVEMLQMFAEIFRPLVASADEIGLDAIADVPPGGHFFSTAHTMQRYKSAFYAPLVSDWRNYGQWREDGELTVTQRANRLWHQTLERFAPPPHDPAVTEALEAFVARRKADGGAAPVS